MRVFVTGATGFIGSAVVQELIRSGHRVVGLARSDASADRLRALGIEFHRGSLSDPAALGAAARSCDGVIHTAFIHDDFSNMAAAGIADLRAIEAFGDALAGSGKPLVVTSGIAHLPSRRTSSEDDVPDPNGPASHRIASEAATLALSSRQVRASLIRLPPSVHGEGDHAFVPALIGVARDQGVSAFIGDGLNRWPAVHRLDAAVLFRLALENGTAGARYHGVADSGIALRDIAAVIGRRLDLPIVSRSPEHFGWLGGFVGIDCPSSSARTQQQLQWRPRQPGLLADLDSAAYFGH